MGHPLFDSLGSSFIVSVCWHPLLMSGLDMLVFSHTTALTKGHHAQYRPLLKTLLTYSIFRAQYRMSLWPSWSPYTAFLCISPFGKLIAEHHCNITLIAWFTLIYVPFTISTALFFVTRNFEMMRASWRYMLRPFLVQVGACTVGSPSSTHFTRLVFDVLQIARCAI